MALSDEQKKALLNKMRDKQKQVDSKSRDTTEWRPPKVEKDKSQSFRVIFLPPVEKGDKVAGSSNIAMNSMEFWCYPHGHHFVNNKRYECPRTSVGKSDCPMCSTGFDLMRETDDKEVRSSLAKEWLSRQSYAANVYFPKHKDNPEELQGKVMWWSMPDAVYEICKKVMNSDDAGDADEPKAHGLFFLPEECYVLNVVINHKNGYNNYESSAFLGKARALASSDEEEKAILAERHDIPSKFEAPDLDAIIKLVDSKAGSKVDGDNKSGDDGPPPRTDKVAEKPAEKVEKPAEKPARTDDDGPPPRKEKTAEKVTEKQAKPVVEDPDIDSLLKQLGQHEEEKK